MFAKYYQDELAWLREAGRELAAARPELARHLAEAGADPDVERLLEGFAFLTGRVREKLDDEFPEITHGLMEMLCPHYLRPIPAMAILQVTPRPNMPTAGVVVPRGTSIDSTPIDGTRCRFTTTADLMTSPFELAGVEFATGHPSRLALRLRLRPGRDPAELSAAPLRLHLSGDTAVTRGLFVALCHGVARVTATPGSGGEPVVVPVEASPAGLADAEAALPVPEGSFGGYRLLQEYFAFPERFLFVDLPGVERAAAAAGSDLVLGIEFRELPEGMPHVTAGNLLLDCVPAINLFAHDADPVRTESERFEYRVRPAGVDPEHYEIYSIDAVVGRMRGSAEPREYRRFFSFDAQERTDGRFYQAQRSESIGGSGTELFLRLGEQGHTSLGDLDTVSLDLTCTNRDLPTRLVAGAISEPSPDAPLAFDYRSIGTPSSPVPPPLGDEVHWRLLSHMTLNLRALADRDTLCTALALYDFRARVDRQARRRLDNLLSGIQRVEATREIELYEGVPIRGVELHVVVDEEPMGGEGEAFLLGTVLSEFLAQYVSLNSFARLRVTCSGHGEVFTWPARIGRRITL